MKIKLLLVSFFGLTSSLFATLSGDYTIGASGDYVNFEQAIVDLNNLGVSSSVRFIVEDGFYSNRLTINDITGVSSTDTVLFVAASGDPGGVVLNIEATLLTDNYQLKLNGSKYITFKGMKFETTSNTYCGSVRLMNGASYNRFDNCIFSANLTIATTGDSSKVFANQAPATFENFNQIIGCRFSGGGVAIALTGLDTDNNEQGNFIMGNDFSGQMISAVQVVFNKNGKFEKNKIVYSGPANATDFFLDSLYEIVGNKIFCSGPAQSGIYIGNHDYPDVIPKDTLFIVNNMVSCEDGHAIDVFQTHGVIVAHNTLYSESATHSTLSFDIVNVLLSVNNLILNNGTTAAVQISNDGVLVGSNFNGVYTPTGKVGFDGVVDYTTLADWQGSAKSPDPNSVYDVLEFIDNYHDLTPKCGTSNNFILNTNYIPQLSHDINGVIRDPSGFWMGAAEFALPDDHTVGLAGYIVNGLDTLKEAEIEVFGDTSAKEILDLLETTSVNADGSYSFTSLHYTDAYWMKITPNGDSSDEYVKAYHNGELRWDDGFPIVSSDSCGIHFEDIYPRKIASYPVGDYSISGTIAETGGLGKMLGTDPIPGLDVVLDKIPPSKNTIAVTQTDEYGNYSFEGLSEGTYVVTIDYEGLPADTMYEIELGAERTQATNQNYCVDTLASIEGCHWGLESSIEVELTNNIFPNPVVDVLYVQGIKGYFDLQVLDLKGRLVYVSGQLSGNAEINMETLSSGVYYLQINQENKHQSVKIVK